MCCCADATGRPQCNGLSCFMSLLRCMMSYKETRLFVFCFFKNPNKSLRSDSAARLGSPSCPLGLLLRHIFLKTCLAITFWTLISCTENKDHRVGRWVTRRCDEHRDSNRAGGKKTTWSFLFSNFDLLIWRPYLLCGSVHKPSPLVATHWARPLSFPSTTLIISPSLPPSLLAINFVQAWKIHHVGGLIRAGVFCQSSSCVWTFWTFNSLSF